MNFPKNKSLESEIILMKNVPIKFYRTRWIKNRF